MQRFKTLLPCKASLILMALCLWVLALLPAKETSGSIFGLFLAGACLGSALLVWRFQNLKVLFWWLFCLVVFQGSVWLQQPQKPASGIYTIVNIRNGYAIAQNGRQRAIVYETEDLLLDQKVELSGFEAIHTQRNEGLFCFQDYLQANGSQYSATQMNPLKTSQEKAGLNGFLLRQKIWIFVNSRSAAPLYRLLFYGLSEDENLDWISTTGLPLIALVYGIRKRLSYRVEKKKLNWLMVGLQLSLTLFFPVRQASLRLLVFQICTALFSDWNVRWPVSMLAFLWISPFGADSLSLVLPAGISFFSHFVQASWQKKVVGMLWIAFCQMIWLKELNLLMLGMFLWFRSLIGWVFLLSIPGLWSAPYGELFLKLLEGIQVSLDWCTVYGSPPLWYLMLFGGLLILTVWKWKTKRFVLLLMAVCIYPWSWNLDPFFHVFQIDVGQGDAALIVEPFQRSVTMIDAAGKMNTDNATKLFIPFLQRHQIRKIDRLVVSHGDFDHDGAVDSLTQNFPVLQTIRSTKDLDPSQIDQTLPGKPAKLSIAYEFWLLLNERESDPAQENDQSLVCLFQYDGFRYLYTGDASIAIEKQLQKTNNLQADVLKLGHHGSNTSSDPAFLKAVHPTLALISAGYQNRYGHPSVSVLETLNAQGIDRLNTADHGSLHLFSMPHLLFVTSADGLVGWIWKS
ncbi:ComEC/Rec2 family competence protein [Allobaculum sp. JKK-2023]|uniref:ComEC/Rec2 family competence protein n=1 Tax=Allobaculum sp. JKK-2023 TaxID=3108943 RepID=UPI002B058E30|nr:MBL fold metallo-hydrolase [Allobaculum sp. JKK-2023]